MRTLVGSLAIGLGVTLGFARAATAAPPRVLAAVGEGKIARAAIRCVDGSAPRTLSLASGLVAYGGPPTGDRAVAELPRHDGVATCSAGGASGALRLRPMQVRAVSPRVVRDDKGLRLVVALDGQALGPRVAADDGVYLVWRGGLAFLDAACPEASFTDGRVVACAELTRVAGHGPARVRLQSAGRLVEAAGSPIDVDALGAAR